MGYSLLKASGGLSLDPELRVRVKDPTPGDGKVYLSEFAGRSIASLLATDFTLDLKGNLKAKLNLYFKEVTIAKHDWQLARLIDYSSDGQRPVTKSYRLAALAPDPTNVIEGTSGNDVFVVRRAGNDANRYEVILNGRLVSSGSWSSVKDLVLAGGNGNDTFRIETNDHASRGASVTALGDNGNDAFHTVGAGIFVGGAGSDYYTGSDVKFAQDFTIGGPNLTPSTRR